MVTKKQILILLLILSEPGVKGIYTLVKIFDRADFPSNISQNLKSLLENHLIKVEENFDNGTPKNFTITEKGKSFLNNNFVDSEILEFVKQMDDPKLILSLTEMYISQKNGS